MSEGLEERIGTLLAQHRQELAQLVDRVLERELNALVEERIQVHKNGREGHRQAVPLASTKVCRVCGNERPLSEYEAGRGTCRPCRRRQERERAARRVAEPASDEPRPADDRYALPAATLEQWLVAKNFAVRTDHGLIPTDAGLKIGAAIG